MKRICENTSLEKIFGDIPKDVTAENLQSRIRGTLLMAIANQKNHLLLYTGNRSEIAVGYCTLYGDMNGGLSVIGVLYKTEVFKLCEWIDSDDSQECRKALGLPEKGELIGQKLFSIAIKIGADKDCSYVYLYLLIVIS